jgi:hypothetical protein
MEQMNRQSSRPPRWPNPLIMGASIGVGISTAQSVETNMAPAMGSVVALLCGLLTAAVVAAGISLIASWILLRRQPPSA